MREHDYDSGALPMPEHQRIQAQPRKALDPRFSAVFLLSHVQVLWRMQYVEHTLVLLLRIWL